ncbi:interleukin-17C-like [Branchiostoma floridae]|uniref:Interleukin-17C-like n=1 Tax=Branchiostoma floridae TaxID=7739 RepID=A0A9J7LE93_BRAFL|nr:interleukin-17C-like [Branchiostoma floridae]
MKIYAVITVAVLLLALVSAIDGQKRRSKDRRREGGDKERRRQSKNKGNELETDQCEDISDKQKQRKLRGARKAYERTAPIVLAEQLKKDAGRRRRNAEMACPESEAPHDGDISQRAISPWAWELDVDVNRYPTEIAKAKCLCTAGCLVNGKLDFNYASEPIVTQMKVLRRTKCDRKGKWRYEVQWEDVPVGCTCASPKS